MAFIYLYLQSQLFLRLQQQQFHMGNILPQNNPAWRQQYTPQPKDKHYQHLQLYTNPQGQTILVKEIQSSQVQAYHNINLKLQNRTKYTKFIYPIKHHHFEQSYHFCSNLERWIIACDKPFSNLEYVFRERKEKERGGRFSLDQIHLIINNVSIALLSLSSLQQKIHFLDMNRIVMTNTVYILDPLMTPVSKFTFPSNKYPSPQDIAHQYYKTLPQSQQLLSRIFSLGVIILQLCNPHIQIPQHYIKTNNENEQYIDKAYLCDRIAEINDCYLRNKLSVMMDFEQGKRNQVFKLIQKEVANFQFVRFLRKSRGDTFKGNAGSSRCTEMTTGNQQSNNGIFTARRKESADNCAQRKSCQAKPMKVQVKSVQLPIRNMQLPIKTHQQKLTINHSYKSDRAHQNKSLPPSTKQIPSNPISISIPRKQTIITKQNRNPIPLEPKLKKQTIVKFINKTPEYKININQIKRHQNDNKENMMCHNNIINNNDNTLDKPQDYLRQPLQQQHHNEHRKHGNSENTPVKEKKKHYFSTIKEVTENDQCYSQQKDIKSLTASLFGRFQGQLNTQGYKTGKGIFYFTEGCVYDGQWKDNKMNGYGKLYYPNGKLAYQGQWLDNQFNGHGKVYNDKPKILATEFYYRDFNRLQQEWIYYEGGLVQDIKEGLGIFYLSNNEYYQGWFRDDKLQGEGRFYCLNGQIIKGIWKDNILQKIIP